MVSKFLKWIMVNQWLIIKELRIDGITGKSFGIESNILFRILLILPVFRIKIP